MNSSSAFKIALLAASGVSETEMTAIQRTLASSRMRATVISPENGLIHSWAEGIWGHCYPADARIEVSLGSDFDMLIIPGGSRHIEKLMANPHTKRFVSAFFVTNKPVAAFAEGETILASNELAGENAQVLRYEGAQGLVEAAAAMMAQFEKHMASELKEAA